VAVAADTNKFNLILLGLNFLLIEMIVVNNETLGLDKY